MAPRRRFSRRPSQNATARPQAPVMTMGRIIGTNSWPTSTPRALAARAVGPPQGRMFMLPPAIMTTQVSTSRLMPSRR